MEVQDTDIATPYNASSRYLGQPLLFFIKRAMRMGIMHPLRDGCHP